MGVALTHCTMKSIALVLLLVALANGLNQCDSYNTLSDPSRSVNSGIGSNCDESYSGYKSPDWVGSGWYRFDAKEFNQMANYPGNYRHCGTYSAGWLDGDIPSVEDGETEMRVCFEGDAGDCWWVNTATVLNCSSYVLYHLQETPACSF